MSAGWDLTTAGIALIIPVLEGMNLLSVEKSARTWKCWLATKKTCRKGPAGRGKTFQALTCELGVYDRVGGGSAAGHLYGLLKGRALKEAIKRG